MTCFDPKSMICWSCRLMCRNPSQEVFYHFVHLEVDHGIPIITKEDTGEIMTTREGMEKITELIMSGHHDM